MAQSGFLAFGGSGLDRAADLRSDSEGLMAAPARCLPFWRGRPLFTDETLSELVWLPRNHPALADPAAERVFIGRDDDGALIFAQTVSDWDEAAADQARQAGNFERGTYQYPALSEGAVFAELRAGMAALSPREAEIAATARGIFAWHETHRFCATCGHPSDLAAAGWERRCPACKRSHFPRTDPVVIALITHGNSVLLGRSPGWPEGMYSLLAGFMEPGETMEAAVRREVFEETAIEVGEVSYLVSQPWPFPSSLMLGCKGVATSSEITIDPHEIEDARWVSKEELVQAFAGEHPSLKPARRGSIAQFILSQWLVDTW